MKKTMLAFIMIALWVISLSGQEIVIQEATPFTYAYLEYSGPYAQMPAKIGEFMQEFFSKQKLMPTGNFFSMYLNAPGEVKEEELRWRLGFPILTELAVTAPLQKGECPGGKIAVYLHIGPYEKLGEAYTKMFAAIEAQGLNVVGPPIEKYLDQNPQAVKPEELRTEINVLVEKK